jgi:hypothetical protein
MYVTIHLTSNVTIVDKTCFLWNCFYFFAETSLAFKIPNKKVSVLVLLLLETQKASLIHKQLLILTYSILIGSWFAQIGLVGLSNEENIYILPVPSHWAQNGRIHVVTM